MLLLIKRWKVLICLRPMPVVSIGTVFDYCLSSKIYQIQCQSKLISLMNFSLLHLEKMRKSAWRCLLDSSSMAQMKSSGFFILSKSFAFWNHLNEKLCNCGIPQDPCDTVLFIGNKVIAICYINDLIFWESNENKKFDLARAKEWCCLIFWISHWAWS